MKANEAEKSLRCFNFCLMASVLISVAMSTSITDKKFAYVSL